MGDGYASLREDMWGRAKQGMPAAWEFVAVLPRGSSLGRSAMPAMRLAVAVGRVCGRDLLDFGRVGARERAMLWARTAASLAESTRPHGAKAARLESQFIAMFGGADRERAAWRVACAAFRWWEGAVAAGKPAYDPCSDGVLRWLAEQVDFAGMGDPEGMAFAAAAGAGARNGQAGGALWLASKGFRWTPARIDALARSAVESRWAWNEASDVACAEVGQACASGAAMGCEAPWGSTAIWAWAGLRPAVARALAAAGADLAATVDFRGSLAEKFECRWPGGAVPRHAQPMRMECEAEAVALWERSCLAKQAAQGGEATRSGPRRI